MKLAEKAGRKAVINIETGIEDRRSFVNVWFWAEEAVGAVLGAYADDLRTKRRLKDFGPDPD